MRTILPLEQNPALRAASEEIPHDEITSTAIRKLIVEMQSLLTKEEHGVALAAVQVGEPVRLFIVSGKALARGKRSARDEASDASENDEQPRESAENLVFINPVLLKLSRGRTNKHEGCLSIKGKWGEVPRAEKATLRYVDENGRQQERGAAGFLAHIFQHEMDHLDGVLYIDKAIKLYDEEEEKHDD